VKAHLYRLVPGFRYVLAGLLLAGAVGCNKKGTVSGKVTYDGKPVLVGTVTFHTEKRQVVAAIDDNGVYTVTGVPLGEAKITVDTSTAEALRKAPAGPPGGPPKDIKAPKDFQSQIEKEGGAANQQLKERAERARNTPDVPTAYTKPDTSGVTLTVKAGSQEFNIDLPKK
jgi:hypothetical protein